MTAHRESNKIEQDSVCDRIAASDGSLLAEAYLTKLRNALRRTGRFDFATTELIIQEMRTHIHMLCEQAECAARDHTSAATWAVSRMEDPNQLTDMWIDADQRAFDFSPATWAMSRIRAWAQFLNAGDALRKAVLISGLAIPITYLLAKALPSAWQEVWLVPLNAFAIAFIAIAFATARIFNHNTVLCGLLLAGGATGATYLTEFVTASGAPYANGLGYATMAAALAAAIALSFGLTHGSSMRLICEYCRLAWPLLFMTFLSASLLVRFIIGGSHAVMYVLFVGAGVLMLNMLERYWKARNPELRYS